MMKESLRIVVPLTATVLGVACAAPCPPPNDPASTPKAPMEPAPAAPEPAQDPAPEPESEADAAPAPPPAPDANSFAEGQKQIVALAKEIKFGPCPPAIPFECEMAVLEGNPKQAGLFTARFRSKKPWLLPPHTHPRAERVTVLSGKVSVGFGTTADKTRGKQFSEGDYYVNAPDTVHYVWADGPIEIQVTGMGPWEVHPHKE